LIAGGVYVLAYAVSNRAAVPGQDGETTDNTYTNRMSLGAGLCMLGAVAGIWGGATVISNASTKVKGNVTTARVTPAPAPTTASTTAAPRPQLASFRPTQELS